MTISRLIRESILFSGLLLFSSAQAATFTVTATNDDVDAAPGDGACAGPSGCTLRAAIQESNALAGADTIVLPAGTYLLTLSGGDDTAAIGDLDITDDLTITGGVTTDPADTVIDGGGMTGVFQDRIFEIIGAAGRPITVDIAGVTITGGVNHYGNGGGGICHHCDDNTDTFALPTLNLRAVAVTGNFSNTGGAGLASYGYVTIDDSSFTTNVTPYVQSAPGVPGGGFGLGGGMGGAILNWGGTIAIARSTFTGNGAQSGGALYNQDNFLPGVIAVVDSVFEQNRAAMGGAIYNVAIGQFNFAGRTAGDPGMRLERVTIAGNYADIDGGGIYNLGTGTLFMENATVSDNRTGGQGGLPNFPNRGGGIYHGGRLLELSSVTLAGNESAAVRTQAADTDGTRGGDELFFNTTNAGGDPATTIPFVVRIRNTIIGDDQGVDDNCLGPVGYQDFVTNNGANTEIVANIDSGTTCAFLIAAANQTSVQPLLGPLQDNGGLTPTRAIFQGSPAIGAGSNCPAVDQRGVARTGPCDIGAFQAGSGAVAPPVNTPPVARDAAYTVVAGQSVNGTLVAVDNEGDALVYAIRTNGSLGTARLLNVATGAFSYTANAGSSGTDQFTFVASDGVAESNVATVTVTITAAPAANRPPAALGSEFSVAPGGVFSAGLTATDPDGDPLTFSVVTPPNQGTVQIDDPATGAFTFTADAAATGTDSFTFQASDGQIASNVATVTINFSPGNTPPVANDGVLSVAAGTAANGTLTGSDPDGDPLTFILVADGLKGSVTALDPATGAYTYEASANASGTDSFTFKVNDGMADSPVATVTVTIVNNNAPPVADPGILTLQSTGSVTGQLTATDTDGDTLTYSIVTPPSQGTVQILDAQRGTFLYSANPGATGTDTFTFTASDGVTQSAPAEVTIDLSAVGGGGNNAPPLAQDVSFAVQSNTLTGVLPANDRDGQGLTFAVLKQPAKGNVQLDETTGQFTYVAEPTASGTDLFTYSASDGLSRSNTAVVRLVLARNRGDESSAPAGGGGSPPAVDGGSGGGGGVLGWSVLIAAGFWRRRRRRGRPLTCL